MKKFLVVAAMILACGGAVMAAPAGSKIPELRGHLLDKTDLPYSRMKGIDVTDWAVAPATPTDTPICVESLVQRIWKTAGQTEIMIQTAKFDSRDDALKAALSKVSELKQEYQLEDKALKGGQLPGQSSGDRIWGLYDPAEADWKTNPDPRACPRSQIGAVVFVKKEVCIAITAHSLRSDVNLDDLESMAKKISTKIKTNDNNSKDSTSK